MLFLLETVVVVLLALMIGVPLLTLLHELGHAIVAATLIGGRVMVVQGSSPARLQFSVWRLDLRLRGPGAPHQGMVGWALWGQHPSRPRHAFATVAGPLTSMASTFGCVAGAAETASASRLLLTVLATASALQTLSSGLPVRYGRWFGRYADEASDGLRTRRLLQGKPEPQPPVAV